MFCPSCNSFRPANSVPCPCCQAPSPLVSRGQGENSTGFLGNAWGGTGEEGNAVNTVQVPFPSTIWQDPSDGTGQQLPFPQAPQTGNLWMQVMSPSTDQQNAQAVEQQSFLPVPYQDQRQPSLNSLMVLPTGFPAIPSDTQGANPLLPALPNAENAPVYVAPMYTKPRPITPRYRAISGLISVIVVSLLLCAGAGYYAQVTGKLVFVQKMFGNYVPPKISSTQNMLAVPSTQLTFGPANNIITSAAISNNADRTINQVATYVNQFTVGQTIFITCSANTTQAGTIIVKLYTNNNLYATLQQSVAANTSGSALFTDAFAQPAEGKAEIYWADAQGQNAQLAVTMLFVVQPQA